ncbi:MAG: outer membrane lipoprotein-sorting protein [Balneolaceae bacterium]
MNLLITLFIGFMMWQNTPTAEAIIQKVDDNINSENRVVESKMIIRGKRGKRVITSKSWSVGYTKSLTEYVSPARERGTKMLKLEDELYIYSPTTDRTISLSGHMLRQSVMGSDLSYEDMMEDRKLLDIYSAELLGEELLEDRKVYVLELIAKVDDAAYQKRKMWIDTERFIPLKEELFAKSGQLLKKTIYSDVSKIDNRWFPKTVVYKDMLKDGDGTVFTMIDIKFNQDIPDYIFSKAALKR